MLLHLLQNMEGSVLVFGRTKHGCDKVVRILNKKGVKAAAIHGNKSQNARQKALKSFKAGELKVLVATDIAARGIDISGLEHVVNYELPNIAETYVHRIGRTGRADASGASVSLCAADEREYLKGIEKLIKASIPLVEEHPSGQPVLLKNGQILRIENQRNQDNAHRAVKSRDRKVKVKGIDLPREVDSAVKNDAQSAQEETNLHKKPRCNSGALY